MDDVLLVASSRSFGAVNREQFYVSISRGRERCHIFTDDADLLARRVTDSHERKAAVELQALRDELAKLGFLPRPQLKEKTITPASTGRQDFRDVRPMREMRATRLSLPHRLTRWADELRRWLGEKLNVERKETVAEKLMPAKTVKQKPTLREQVQRAIQEYHQQKNRPSRGYRP